MKYSQQFLQYFLHTEHVGQLHGNDVLSAGHIGKYDHFDTLMLSIQVKDSKIAQAAFHCATTPALIAAAEYICHWLEGRTLSAIDSLQSKQILQELELDATYIHIANLICNVCGDLRNGIQA